MTNTLIATLSLVISTNWVTVSRTTPVCGIIGCAVFHRTTLNQIGYKVEKRIATVDWCGRLYPIELDTLASNGKPCAERSIEEPNPIQMMHGYDSEAPGYYWTNNFFTNTIFTNPVKK